MTVLSARQVADYWVAEGGPANRAVEWVAIAIGESSLDDSAVSPAGAIGLWQIMPFHAGEFGITVDSLYDPRTNALVAVSLSGHGTNCAAWDSCYRDIYASGRYSFLAWPEVGSADYNNLATAANLLGSGWHYTGAPGVPPVETADITAAMANMQTLANRVYKGLDITLRQQRAVIDRVYTR